jgi:hypothetical protein
MGRRLGSVVQVPPLWVAAGYWSWSARDCSSPGAAPGLIWATFSFAAALPFAFEVSRCRPRHAQPGHRSCSTPRAERPQADGGVRATGELVLRRRPELRPAASQGLRAQASHILLEG